MNREPAAIVAAITSAVTAIIGLLVAFGLDLTADQQTAILAVVAVVGPLTAGLIIRGKVFAPASVSKTVARHAKILPVPDADDTV